MNKNGSIGALILLFVGVIVAAAILPEIFANQKQISEKQVVTDELINIATARNSSGAINITANNNFTIAEVPTGWNLNNCLPTLDVYENSSTVFTVDVDYKYWASVGKIQLLGTDQFIGGTNSTYATYTYCADGYAGDGGSRAIANTIGLFAVIGLLGFVIYYGIKEYV